MIYVIIVFESGFKNDTVIIKVNDQQVFNRKGITTKMQLGYAGSAKINVMEGDIRFEIFLPEKSLSKTIFLESISDPIALILSIEKNSISNKISFEPGKIGYG